MNRKAKCACGAVSITVAGEPHVHAVCHCGNCKKRSGSAFGVNAYFEKAKVVGMEGNTSVYAFHNAGRDEDQERHFCSRCGTTLYGYNSRYPDLLWIAGGCFADEPLNEPSSTASMSKKWDWVSVPSAWKVWPE